MLSNGRGDAVVAADFNRSDGKSVPRLQYRSLIEGERIVHFESSGVRNGSAYVDPAIGGFRLCEGREADEQQGDSHDQHPGGRQVPRQAS